MMKGYKILRALRFVMVAFLLASVCLAQTQTQPPKKKLTFWQRLIRFAGISATPSAQKAPGDDTTTGDIWVVEVTSSVATQLTHTGGYRSPIFLAGDQKILALKGIDLVEIDAKGGDSKPLFCLKGAVKLIGIDLDESNSILILTEDQNHNPELGLLSLSNREVTGIPREEGEDYTRILTHAQGWERVYGTTKVYVKTNVKNDLAGALEWSDVYLKQVDSPARNLSRCDGINCVQPSLSQDGRLVAYVKAPE